MTIKMRLDTDGLRAMIANNPELEIEIGREVMNNIKDDILQAKVNAKIEACLKGMVKNEGTWRTPRYVPVTEDFKAMMHTVVMEAVQHSATERLKEYVAEMAATAIRTERDKIGVEVKAILRELVTADMAREIMREKIL